MDFMPKLSCLNFHDSYFHEKSPETQQNLPAIATIVHNYIETQIGWYIAQIVAV